MIKKKIFITGGAGYVGSRLVESLLKNSYEVTVFDIMWFGSEHLPKNPDLEIIKGDIRDTIYLKKCSKNHDIFLHLACVSNDTSYQLNEKLSKEINFDCFEPMVIAAKENKISRFIYASTSSVYGVSKEKNVKENHPLIPLTDYNKYKGMCEPILLKNTNSDFEGVIFRPATVCGYSSRQRFDLSVNILTNHAMINNIIRVFGGEQLRPNLNIKDYIRAVNLLVEAPSELIKNQIFNVGYQNLSISDLAEMVKKVLEKKYENKKITIKYENSDDKRSYHINSDKISEILGFKPMHTIEEAIIEIADAIESKKYKDTFNNDLYHNVKRLLNINIK